MMENKSYDYYCLGKVGKGYFVSTVGINEEVIQKYIQSHAEEETGQAGLIHVYYIILKGI